MNKKLMFSIVAVVAILAGTTAQARPGGGRGGPGFRGRGPAPARVHNIRGHHRPPMHRHVPRHRHFHRGRWYNGGLGFAAGVIGAGIVAGTVNALCAPTYYEPVYRTTTPVVIHQTTPVVVQQPTVVTTSTAQKVWVDGHWNVEHDANGNVIKRTWVEGYWQTVQ